MAKSVSGNRKIRPVQWIKDSSAEEICEAIFAIDQAKAYSVLVALARKIGPEAAHLVSEASRRLDEDPIGAVGNFILGGMRRMQG